MVYLIDDVWIYIKHFLFHNIKIHGKHLEDNKHIKKYNNIIKKIPLLIQEADSFRIIYDNKSIPVVKFIYVIKQKNIRKLIIEYNSINKSYNSSNKKQMYNKIREEYYKNIKNADNIMNKNRTIML